MAPQVKNISTSNPYGHYPDPKQDRTGLIRPTANHHAASPTATLSGRTQQIAIPTVSPADINPSQKSVTAATNAKSEGINWNKISETIGWTALAIIFTLAIVILVLTVGRLVLWPPFVAIWTGSVNIYG